MKNPTTPNPKPYTKPKPIIGKPRSKPQLEPQPSYVELQHEVEALKNENLKLCRQIAKFKAENTTLKSQITITTEEYTQYRHDNPPFDPSTITEEDRKMLDEVKKSLLQKSKHKKTK